MFAGTSARNFLELSSCILDCLRITSSAAYVPRPYAAGPISTEAMGGTVWNSVNFVRAPAKNNAHLNALAEAGPKSVAKRMLLK
jgi:hypothetical protein